MSIDISADAWLGPIQTLLSHAMANTAESAAARIEFGLDPAPIRAPYWIDVIGEHGVIDSKSAGGDLREAKRRFAGEAIAAAALSYRAVLTDSAGQVIA